MTKEHNGHKSHSFWEVSVTIANDEWLYNKAREYAQQFGANEDTARRFIDDLAACGIHRTPGGTHYTLERVLAALEEYKEEG